MLPRENHLLGCTRPKASQGSVPAGLTLASGFGFCFQCQRGSSLVLRRPIETTAFTRHLDLLVSCPQSIESRSQARDNLLQADFRGLIPQFEVAVLRETLASASHAMLRALAERGREIHRETILPSLTTTVPATTDSALLHSAPSVFSNVA